MTPEADGRVIVWRWESCTPAAVRQARSALRYALIQLGLPEDTISDAVLAAAELVTNATEHACGPYEMRLRRVGNELICEIEDGDPFIPEIPRLPSTESFVPDSDSRDGGLETAITMFSERGRGMPIVDHLTRGSWGFLRSEGRSKIAWMTVVEPKDD